MAFLSAVRELDSQQRHVVLASFLGWTLDAFDYFLLIFVIPEIAREFHRRPGRGRVLRSR